MSPAIERIHHVTLTVSDLDRTIPWYCDILGFKAVKRLSDGGMEKALLVRDGLIVSFVQHGDSAVAGAFDERRTGLDHLSFAVADRAALDEWVAVLDAGSVRRGEVTRGLNGWVVAFRDPDNIALEFYTLS